MKDTTSSNSGGIGFVGALTILFIGLKLTGHIGWSWWWVLSPVWVSALTFVGILAIVFGAEVIWRTAEKRNRRSHGFRR